MRLVRMKRIRRVRTLGWRAETDDVPFVPLLWFILMLAAHCSCYTNCHDPTISVSPYNLLPAMLLAMSLYILFLEDVSSSGEVATRFLPGQVSYLQVEFTPSCLRRPFYYLCLFFLVPTLKHPRDFFYISSVCLCTLRDLPHLMCFVFSYNYGYQ